MDENSIELLDSLMREAVLELRELEKQAEELSNRIDLLHDIVYMGVSMDEKSFEVRVDEAYDENEPTETEKEKVDEVVAATDEEQILQHLEKFPGRTRSELVDADLLHDDNILQRMRRGGLIISAGNGRSSRWYKVAD